MKKHLISIILFSNLFSLVGCSPMNSSFDCPNKAGVSCRSLDQINKMIDDGQIRGGKSVVAVTSNKRSADFDCYVNDHQGGAHCISNQPLRHGETVQRIWIAPYEDTEGNYHQDHEMYTIIRKSHWINP